MMDSALHIHLPKPTSLSFNSQLLFKGNCYKYNSIETTLKNTTSKQYNMLLWLTLFTNPNKNNKRRGTFINQSWSCHTIVQSILHVGLLRSTSCLKSWSILLSDCIQLRSAHTTISGCVPTAVVWWDAIHQTAYQCQKTIKLFHAIGLCNWSVNCSNSPSALKLCEHGTAIWSYEFSFSLQLEVY